LIVSRITRVASSALFLIGTAWPLRAQSADPVPSPAAPDAAAATDPDAVRGTAVGVQLESWW
jgi:hypothetical protein